MDILKENFHNFSNFLKNVINDLYNLCFQNYCTLLIEVVLQKNNLSCINNFLVRKLGGGGKNSPLNSPLSNIIAVPVKINILDKV